MDQLSQLPGRTQVQLLRAIEAAPAVQHRGQFFLWAQGQLQGVLPHGLLMGVLLDAEARPIHFDCLQAIPVAPDLLASLTSLEGGLVVQAAQLCHSPPQGADADAVREVIDAVLGRTALGPAMWEGSGRLNGAGSTFFALMGLQGEVTPAQSMMLRVLMPQLHMALLRSHAHARVGQADQEDDMEITERQLEILHWVKLGKTNFEIAQILDISALTVKNHLQKMFKKLNVHNRAQAVAKIMTLNSLHRTR
jgi:transcriptional regulator EpsA